VGIGVACSRFGLVVGGGGGIICLIVVGAVQASVRL